MMKARTFREARPSRATPGGTKTKDTSDMVTSISQDIPRAMTSDPTAGDADSTKHPNRYIPNMPDIITTTLLFVIAAVVFNAHTSSRVAQQQHQHQQLPHYHQYQKQQHQQLQHHQYQQLLLQHHQQEQQKQQSLLLLHQHHTHLQQQQQQQQLARSHVLSPFQPWVLTAAFSSLFSLRVSLRQPHPSPAALPHPSPAALPRPSPAALPRPSPAALPRPSPAALPHPSPAALPRPSPAALPRPSPAALPRPSPAALPHPSPAALPRPSPAALPRPSPAALPRPSPAALPHPSPAALPHPSPAALPHPSPAALPHPSPAALPRPSPAALPRPSPAALTMVGALLLMGTVNGVNALHPVRQPESSLALSLAGVLLLGPLQNTVHALPPATQPQGSLALSLASVLFLGPLHTTVNALPSVNQPKSSLALPLTSALLFLAPLSSVHALSPVDELVQEILASNLSAEAKFQAVTLAQHRRYCETSRTCLSGVDYGQCGYCLPCQCDDQCRAYGDCCPDTLFDGVQEVQPLEMTSTCRDNLYGGYTAAQRKSRLANSTSYLMTTTCPPSAPQQLVDACADESKFLPVSSPEEGGVNVYGNAWCAQCHGLETSTLESWKTMLFCESGQNWTSSDPEATARKAAQLPDCFLLLYPPPNLPPPRKCYFDDSIISTCNVTGAWPSRDEFTERACAAYLDPKLEEGRLFQNVFCYICNSADPQLFETMCAHSGGINPMPFSALLDFSDVIYGGAGPVVTTPQCGSSEVYDDTTARCRPIVCAPRRQFMDGVCVPVFGSVQGLGYALYFRVDLAAPLALHDGDDMLHNLPGMLEYQLTWDTPIKQAVRLTGEAGSDRVALPAGRADVFQHLLSMLENQLTWNRPIREDHFEVSFEITDVSGRCSQQSQELRVFCTFLAMAERDQREFEQQLLALRNTSLTLRNCCNITTKADEGVWTDKQYSGGGGLAAGGRGCSTVVSNHHEVLEGDADVIYTRVNDLMTLPRVALARDEFHVRTSDLRLEVAWLDDTIPRERYESTEEGIVYIALDDFLPKITVHRQSVEQPADEAEVILSVVCTCLSLAGLALTFGTYALFQPLRTAPGKNNMTLCATLFLAQLFYLLGSGRTEVPGLCQAMAILIHYFWLAAFAAMSVCCYSMWRVFCSLRAAEDEADQRRRLLLNSVYIWGSATAGVVLTLLVHIIVTGGEDIGYGGRWCYLSTAAGVGLAVGLPVAVLLSASLVFFLLTVRTIRRSPKLTRCKSRDDQRLVWVYFKLSSLTGITWALAFVVFFTQVTALRYVFTALNGLQGVFICVSFVCNRRVAKLYRACLQGRHPGGLTSGSGTAATTSSSVSSSYRGENHGNVSTISRKTETSFADPAVSVSGK